MNKYLRNMRSIASIWRDMRRMRAPRWGTFKMLARFLWNARSGRCVACGKPASAHPVTDLAR